MLWICLIIQNISWGKICAFNFIITLGQWVKGEGENKQYQIKLMYGTLLWGPRSLLKPRNSWIPVMTQWNEHVLKNMSKWLASSLFTPWELIIVNISTFMSAKYACSVKISLNISEEEKFSLLWNILLSPNHPIVHRGSYVAIHSWKLISLRNKMIYERCLISLPGAFSFFFMPEILTRFSDRPL